MDWPDHVAIAVTERVPVMAVRMAHGGYDLVDPSGVIVLLATAKPAGLPLFTTSLSGAALRADPGVAAVSAVLAELAPSLARDGQQRVGRAGADRVGRRLVRRIAAGDPVHEGRQDDRLG